MKGLPWLGLGAVTLGAWLAMRKPRFRWWLAAVHAPDWLPLAPRLPELWRAGISGLDIRIATPDSGTTAAERQLAAAVLRSGGRVRCHGWQGRRSAAGYADVSAALGAAQARNIVSRAHELSEHGPVELASGNFERDVWRWPGVGAGHTASPHALDYLRAWLDTFEAQAPHGLQAGDLGFANPAEHYQHSDHNGDGQPDAVIPRDILGRWGRRGVMAYGSTPASVLPRLERAREATPADVPLSWWHSVGRLDQSTGQVGQADTLLEGWARKWGGIDEAVGYVGFGAIGQVFDGHAKHPALVSLIDNARGVA